MLLQGTKLGFPGISVDTESTCSAGSFHPWIRKIHRVTGVRHNLATEPPPPSPHH